MKRNYLITPLLFATAISYGCHAKSYFARQQDIAPIEMRASESSDVPSLEIEERARQLEVQMYLRWD